MLGGVEVVDTGNPDITMCRYFSVIVSGDFQQYLMISSMFDFCRIISRSKVIGLQQ